MGQTFDASIRFGVVLPEEHVYEHYDTLGANLESDSEWTSYEEPEEALDAHVERLTKESNLELVTVGYFYGTETTRHILALEDPYCIETGYGDDYYCKAFDPKRLDAGNPNLHVGAIQIAKKLDLDWTTASWHLCWSVS